MKTNEFIEYMKKNTNAATRGEQVVSLAKKTLEIKSYLGIKDKKNLVDKIINKTIYFDDGVFRFDGIEQYVHFTMLTIAAYTNLELSDDIEDDFDALSESKLLQVVVHLIQSEYDDVNLFLQMQCDHILENNSIEAQCGKFFSNILEKADRLEKNLSGFVNNEDVAKMLKDKDTLLNLLSRVTK